MVTYEILKFVNFHFATPLVYMIFIINIITKT